MKKRHRILLIFLMILSLAGELGIRADAGAGHGWTDWPGFYLMFGFMGCIVIILGSKALGKAFLQKKEDYYDAG